MSLIHYWLKILAGCELLIYLPNLALSLRLAALIKIGLPAPFSMAWWQMGVRLLQNREVLVFITPSLKKHLPSD